MLRMSAIQRVFLISLLVFVSTTRFGSVSAGINVRVNQGSEARRINSFSADPEMNAVLSTWHVATHGSDVTGNGTEANPFATIQHGIDTAANGDTVLVQPGVYRENINFNGKNITVGSLFVTTGNEDYILQTVIDGRRNDHVVALVNGETAAARLSGFTVINGYARSASWPGNSGGGIICLNSNPTLSHLKIMSNESVQEGGGVYLAHCAAAIRDVTITNNRAGSGGGGIRYSYGSVSLDNAIVAHNLSQSGGAGIQFYHSEGAITNTLISDNSGGAKGGGLHFDGCSPTFINATIVGNWTAGRGGGLNVSYMSQPTLVNSIVWGNSPEQIYFDTDWPGEAISIEYSDIQGGAAGIVTNGHGPVNWGAGNLNTSPRFVDAGLGNYRLADDSPALNAGKVAGAPPTDIEGNPRPSPAGSKPDMGAYENPSGLTVSSSKVYLPIIFSQAAAPVTVIPGNALQFPRTRHTATRLLDGKILIVGGSRASNDHLAEVELFDPATGVSSQVAALHTPRHQHTATLLPNGRVLIVGGYSLPQQWLSDAEVYDPAANTWTIVSPPHKHGVEHTATVLKDGRVLVVGGCIGSSLCTDRVDIFNPQTNAWTEALSLPSDRASHTAQLLNDGRVLIAGGGRGIDNVPLGGDALLYDPQMNTWAPTGSMVTMRLAAQAVQLADGRVLVTGGLDTENPSNPLLSASTEIYDPASNTWTSTAHLSQIRVQHNLVRLEDGKVLAIGGVRDPEGAWTANSFVREIESYDPLTNWWSISSDLLEPRANATATLLPDGRVWVTGGRYLGTYWSSTWLIDASTP
jgi:N-acetylneuraminic acid mutarotase